LEHLLNQIGKFDSRYQLPEALGQKWARIWKWYLLVACDLSQLAFSRCVGIVWNLFIFASSSKPNLSPLSLVSLHQDETEKGGRQGLGETNAWTFSFQASSRNQHWSTPPTHISLTYHDDFSSLGQEYLHGEAQLDVLLRILLGAPWRGDLFSVGS